jgi:hypothetical protein
MHGVELTGGLFQLVDDIIVCGLKSFMNRGQDFFEIQFLENKLLVEALIQIADGGKHAKEVLGCFEQQSWS